MNLVQESARHLEMTRARQMRVDTRDLAEAHMPIVHQSPLVSILVYELSNSEGNRTSGI